MGIYGILVVQEAGGGPYTGIPAPDNDITLLFSEIDPAIHNAANDVTRSFPSTNDYKPKYFLINGKPFPRNNPILIGTAGQSTLLRFLNAGLDTYVPLLQGQSMQVLAEDAFLKPANLRFTRYSVDLHAGKTFDALITNPAAGYIPVYDRRLYLSNAAKAPGGMLAYLEVTDATQYQLRITKSGTGTGTVAVESAPGGTYCQGSFTDVPPDPGCSQLYNVNTELKLVGHPNPGSILALASDGTPFVPDTNPPVPAAWTGCDSVTDANECIITMNGDKPITANFKAFDKVKLLTPNGGETIPAGSAYLVQWGAPANAATFRLRYSLDGGATWLLIKKGITGNSFNWNVPTPGKNRKSALLEVTAFNKAGTNIGSDVANAAFTIETVTVTVPALGDTLISGDIAVPHTITWVSGATPGLVKKIVIEYSKDNGVTWKPVEVAGVPVKLDNSSGIYDAGGSFSQWEILPAVKANKPDSFVRVTLKDAAGNIVARDKSGKFTIRVP
jgi:FtsP/CotA-like multicopper oxidase with cupredoxin domain